MNSDYANLAAALAAKTDELWSLHLTALQLATEGPTPALAARLADGLDQLVASIETVMPPELRARLDQTRAALRRGEVAESAEPLLRLIDALTALQRGEGATALAVALARHSDSNVEPQPSALDRNDEREDQVLFAAEAREHVRLVEARLVEIERTRDLGLVADVFRGIHSIKGGAQYLGVEAMAGLAHRAETVLDRLRSGRLALSAALVSTLLRAVDALSKTVADLEAGSATADTEPVLRELQALIAGEAASPAPLAAGSHDTEPATDGEGVAETARPDDAGDKDLFVTEFRENLRSAASLLHDLASLASSPSSLVTASRNLHSLKGLAGLAGLQDMERLAGAIDTALNRVVRADAAGVTAIQSPVDASITLLGRLFAEYEADGRTTTAIAEAVTVLDQLGASAQPAPQPSQPPVRGPLSVPFAALAAALRGEDRASVDAAFTALVRAAELQGCDEVVARARTLRARWTSGGGTEIEAELPALGALLPADLPGVASGKGLAPLTFDGAALAVPGIGARKLRRLVEAGIDSLEAIRRAGVKGLIAVPGIGVEQARMLLANAAPREDLVAPDSAGGSAVEAADFERELLDDAHDRSLVQIYLTTTARQAAGALDRLREGDAAGGLRMVSDLASSARYMRYAPLAETFESAVAQLGADTPDTEAAASIIAAARHRIEALARRVSSAALPESGPSRELEATELERIFGESAEAHLGAVLRHLLDFVVQMDEARLGSLQHHLSCVHSAATNVGREAAAVVAGRLQSGVEDLWLSPAAVDRASVAGLFGLLRDLFEACGLEAPTVDIPTRLARPVSMAEPASEPPLQEREAAEAVLAALRPDETPADLPAPGRAPADPAAAVEPASPSDPVSRAGLEEVSARGDGADRGREDMHEAVPAEQGSSPADIGDAARALVDAQTTLRVDTGKIDDLMNMVAELVVNRSAFMVLGSTVNDLVTRLVATGQAGKGEARDLRTVLTRYDEAMTELGRVSNQLQQGVMRIRMMPVRTLFSRIPRLVRDLALREHREVTVSFSGEDTELDKTVIERLSDPLVHLIRNAIGHGIESAAERRAAGKPAEGRLRISARHQGNIVILEVEDDGRGIDFERIRRRFTEAGLGSAAEASRLGSAELLATLFLPGFSTADRVSDISGRGVGLDVVKRNIESLGGQVDAASEPGRFSRFTIRIPLTMAIMQALLVRVADETYAIPVAAVIQAERITRSRIYSVESQKAITIRNAVIPLVELEEIFAYNYYLETGQATRPPTAAAAGEAVDADSAYVVVVQGEGREIGIVVNGLVGTQDIVIKSLEDELADGRGIAGASILGDGTVTLILDIAEIQKMILDGQHTEELRRSETVRRLERYIAEHGVTGAERTAQQLARPHEPVQSVPH